MTYCLRRDKFIPVFKKFFIGTRQQILNQVNDVARRARERGEKCNE